MTGKLYIIGVGPGDPGLLTARALELLQNSRRVFIPVSGQGRESLALDIIRDHISPEAAVTELVFPMTHDRKIMEEAYNNNYVRISSVVRSGEDAALVTIGDPATYSSAWQVLKLVKRHEPEVLCEIVPGITSYAAAAARAGVQLAQGHETLMVVSSYSDARKLEALIDCADTVVFLKTYRRRDMILDLLRSKGLFDRCVYIRRCGLAGEEIIRDLSALPDEADYFSMIILKKRGFD
jgi:precorrin-2/cobalt-factor-2 C20-methyltransferase